MADIAPSTPFTYSQSLSPGEIRLLRVENDPELGVSYRTTIHRLDEDIEYVALSYAWGWIDITHSIICDDREFLVSKSVHSALSILASLTNAGGDRYLLWIDAICIDQKNLIEKSQQVKMMRNIYGHADLVIGHLGEGAEVDNCGLDLIHQIWNLVLSRQSEDLDLTHASIPELGLPDPLAPSWKATARILNRPWFTRAWIIQEFVYGKNFHFLIGGRLIPGDQIMLPAKVLFGSLWFSKRIGSPQNLQQSTSLARILFGLKRLKVSGQSFKFFELLELSHSFEASDPRDKIFAIAPLCDDIDSNIVDYELGVEEVLIESTIAGLNRNKKSLEMVLCEATSLERNVKVPSWIPVWSSTKFATERLSFSDCADQGTHEVPEFKIDSERHLVILATVIDSISIVTAGETQPARELFSLQTSADTSMVSLASTEEYFQVTESEAFLPQKQLFTNAKRRVDSLHSYPTGQPVSDIFWRSLIQDNDHIASDHMRRLYQAYEDTILQEGELIEVLKKSRKYQEGWTDAKLLGNSIQGQMRRYVPVYITAVLSFILFFAFGYRFSVFGFFIWVISLWMVYVLVPTVIAFAIICPGIFKIDAEQVVRLKNYIHELSNEDYFKAMAWTKGHRLCITRNGYVVWAPKWVREEDEIIIIRGMRLPFIVRRSRAPMDDSARELVGSCYIHGLMNDLKSASGHEETIRIV